MSTKIKLTFFFLTYRLFQTCAYVFPISKIVCDLNYQQEVKKCFS